MFADPVKNVQQFGVTEGMHVADLGAGSGHYTLALAQVLRTGRVYAIDVQKELLDKIAADARSRNYNNVEIIWGNLEKIGGTKLVEASLDAAIISNVLFQVEHKDLFSQEVRRIVKRGGKIMVIDWADSFAGMGPIGVHLVPKTAAIELFQKAGFKLLNDIQAGAHHYGFIMQG